MAQHTLPIPNADMRNLTDTELRRQAANILLFKKEWRYACLQELTVRRILRSNGKKVIVAATTA